MARKTKCPVCGESFDRDSVEFVQKNNRYYHKECFNSTVTERDKLFLYLSEVFGDNLNVALVNKQLKNMIDNQGMTYSGIRGTLDYAFRVKGLDKNKSKGIGIASYLYNEARQYYTKIANAQESNGNTTISNEVYTVEIGSPQLKPSVKYRPIDLNKIMEEITNE